MAVKVVESQEWATIQKSIKHLESYEARVGWFEKDVYPETGEPVASVALKQENGFVTRIPETGRVAIVPPRPFIRPAVDKNRSKIEDILQSEFMDVLEGSTTVEKALGIVSQYTRDRIQQEIKNVHTPPLSPYTIEKRLSKRKNKEFTDSLTKPLIDTGKMFKSVSYTVTKS